MKARLLLFDIMCLECGNISSIQGRTCAKKGLYYVDESYCFCCKNVTKHVNLGDSSLLKSSLELKDELNSNELYIYTLLNHGFADSEECIEGKKILLSTKSKDYY